VPSSSAAPPSTHSGTAAPPPAPSSSSSGSVLRVLKSMFAWCRETHQRQDMLLSKQRCQNEKLGIDEFDEFPLPVPPLDDDPFPSLSAADLVAMEASPWVMKKHLAANMRKTKTTTTTSDLSFAELLLFPFWCLDAKRGEEYLVIMLSCRGLKILKLVCVGRMDMDS
jgi:hypothetical protein